MGSVTSLVTSHKSLVTSLVLVPHPQFPRSAACGGHQRTEGPSSASGSRAAPPPGAGRNWFCIPRPARRSTPALCHTAQICLNGCCFLCLQRGILPAISVATPGGYTPIRWRHGSSARQGSGRGQQPGLLTVVTQNCGLPAVKIFALRGGCRWLGAAAGRAAAASTSPLSTSPGQDGAAAAAGPSCA